MMTKTSPGASRRPNSKRSRHRRFTRKSVLKMLAVMSEDTDEAKDATKDFLTTGRVGRRNAMADILSEHARTSTSDLPEKLNKLSTTEDSASDKPESHETDKSKSQDETSTAGPSGPSS